MYNIDETELAVKPEEWSVIEESVAFVALLNKEKEDCVNEKACILFLHKEQIADTSDEEIEDEVDTCRNGHL